MTPADTPRRPWTGDDKQRLMELWDSVGSIFLIALILDRPEGSVQTEASRLNLPRRSEDKGRHRKKWTPEEVGELEAARAECLTTDGRINIVEVADRVGRSVDAVASRLAEECGSRADLRSSIYVPASVLTARKPIEKKEEDNLADPRKVKKVRMCLGCQTPFFSDGAHNRICKRCKETDDSDWNYSD